MSGLLGYSSELDTLVASFVMILGVSLCTFLHRLKLGRSTSFADSGGSSQSANVPKVDAPTATGLD